METDFNTLPRESSQACTVNLFDDTNKANSHCSHIFTIHTYIANTPLIYSMHVDKQRYNFCPRNTQGHSECDDVCDARLLDCDARNVLCDVAVFDCFVTEENVIWSKQLE